MSTASFPGSPQLPLATDLPGIEPLGVSGGLLLAVMCACILYGVTILQAFIYHQYTKDSNRTKLLVFGLCIFETLHTAFCMQFMYDYLIYGFGDFQHFVSVNWGVRLAVAASVVVGLCAQGYFTWRVWIVSEGSTIWSSVIGGIALTRLGFGIESTILSYDPERFLPDIAHPPLTLLGGGLAFAAIMDLIFAFMLMMYLQTSKRSQVDQHLDSIVPSFATKAANTGALTGIAALLCVIVFTLQRDSVVFLGLFVVQTKLYANSLLASLNARWNTLDQPQPQYRDEKKYGGILVQ